MPSLDFDPVLTRALAVDIRDAAAHTDLSRDPLPAFDDAHPATGRLARSARAAVAAVTHRSRIISAHLASLSQDADTFTHAAVTADGALRRDWEATL